jgi:DNA-binding IclR family transcriptional regulator
VARRRARWTSWRRSSWCALFSAERPEWGATAAARELGIAKSQAHELLVSLTGIGLLQRVGAGRYRVGWRIASLNQLLAANVHAVTARAVPVMRELGERYGETLHVAVWDGEHAVCIAVQDGRLAARVTPPAVGAAMPAHATGPGKVLLAGRPPGELEALLPRLGLARITRRTIVDLPRLHRELAGVRSRGWAYEEGESRPDACTVAAPIVRRGDGVVAAVGLSAPPSRWLRHRGEYVRAVVGAAAQASSGSVRSQ